MEHPTILNLDYKDTWVGIKVAIKLIKEFYSLTK